MKVLDCGRDLRPRDRPRTASRKSPIDEKQQQTITDEICHEPDGHCGGSIGKNKSKQHVALTFIKKTPDVGIEPTTTRLKAERSSN